MDINSSRNLRRTLPIAAGSLVMAWLGGCKHTIEVSPIEVKPIHATLDINLKVDRELDEFFGEVASSESATKPTATAPANSPVTTAPEVGAAISGTAGGPS